MGSHWVLAPQSVCCNDSVSEILYLQPVHFFVRNLLRQISHWANIEECAELLSAFLSGAVEEWEEDNRRLYAVYFSVTQTIRWNHTLAWNTGGGQAMMMNADSSSLAFCDHSTVALFTASSCGGVNTTCVSVSTETYAVTKVGDLQGQTRQGWVVGTL